MTVPLWKAIGNFTIRSVRNDKAKDKLAKQKPPKKPGPVRRVGRVAGSTAHGFVHGKIYENEHENVGIEGAHRSELVGESVLRHGSRFLKKKVREHPAKAVRKAESKYIKATADYHFHTAAQEHPELTKNALSRLWQKKRLRKQYQKRAKEAAKQGARAAEKTAVTTEKLAIRAVGFVKRHPVGCLLALACVMLVLVMQSCSSSLVTLGNSTIGAVGASTYPCEDGDMLEAEAVYCGLEAELQDYLDSYESTHDYDEYHFDLDEIKLKSRYGDFLQRRGTRKTAPADPPSGNDLEITTDDERIVLYCILQKNVRKISKEDVIKWLHENEIHDVNVDNAFDLLSSISGCSMKLDTLEFGIETFRKYSANASQMMSELEGYVDQHKKLAAETFMSMWKAESFDSLMKLFLAYIVDEKVESFGVRWMEDEQIKSIVQWEDKYFLDETLSKNYGSCLQTLIQKELIYESS